MSNDVFHHHHCAVHHHAEVKSTQGEQIRRDVAQIQPDRGKEQRERNGESDDESGTNIQKEQEKNDADQNHALCQVMHYRVQGEMQEIAAIQHGNDRHARGQDAVVEFVHLLVNRIERRLFFGAFAHQHRTLNDIRLVDDAAILHVVRSGHVAQSNLGALGDFRNVFHSKSGSGLSLQDGLLNIVHIAEEPQGTNIHLLHPDLNEAASGIDVVVSELLFDLSDTQSVRDQLVWVDAHLVLA